MARFMIKKSQDVKPQKRNVINNAKNEEVMDKITMAEQILDDTPKVVKKLKKDKGLIERTESSKTILTEDNKELLMD
jgi:hypothetical protein